MDVDVKEFQLQADASMPWITEEFRHVICRCKYDDDDAHLTAHLAI